MRHLIVLISIFSSMMLSSCLVLDDDPYYYDYYYPADVVYIDTRPARPLPPQRPHHPAPPPRPSSPPSVYYDADTDNLIIYWTMQGFAPCIFIDKWITLKSNNLQLIYIYLLLNNLIHKLFLKFKLYDKNKIPNILLKLSISFIKNIEGKSKLSH